jgi:hypothetical protein
MDGGKRFITHPALLPSPAPAAVQISLAREVLRLTKYSLVVVQAPPHSPRVVWGSPGGATSLGAVATAQVVRLHQLLVHPQEDLRWRKALAEEVL